MSKSTTTICGATILVLLLVFCALGPADWQFHTGLGWRFDHVAGYFAFTLLFCLVWPRPFIVGGTLMASGVLLEALQALTPDRHCDFRGALYSAAGALAAGLVVELFTRRRLRLIGPMLSMLPRFRPGPVVE